MYSLSWSHFLATGCFSRISTLIFGYLTFVSCWLVVNFRCWRFKVSFLIYFIVDSYFVNWFIRNIFLFFFLQSVQPDATSPTHVRFSGAWLYLLYFRKIFELRDFPIRITFNGIMWNEKRIPQSLIFWWKRVIVIYKNG